MARASKSLARVHVAAARKHPIYRLLSARLDLVDANVDGNSLWFYGDKTPGSDAVIRQWAADHAQSVAIDKACDGFSVDHRKSFTTIVTWYPAP